MSRLLPGAFLFLTQFSAYAQSSKAADAPTETASPLGVILFLVLFVGSCVAYGVYLWWTSRHKKPGDE